MGVFESQNFSIFLLTCIFTLRRENYCFLDSGFSLFFFFEISTTTRSITFILTVTRVVCFRNSCWLHLDRSYGCFRKNIKGPPRVLNRRKHNKFQKRQIQLCRNFYRFGNVKFENLRLQIRVAVAGVKYGVNKRNTSKCVCHFSLQNFHIFLLSLVGFRIILDSELVWLTKSEKKSLPKGGGVKPLKPSTSHVLGWDNGISISILGVYRIVVNKLWTTERKSSSYHRETIYLIVF